MLARIRVERIERRAERDLAEMSEIHDRSERRHAGIIPRSPAAGRDTDA
jgi:hypothetical protein